MKAVVEVTLFVKLEHLMTQTNQLDAYTLRFFSHDLSQLAIENPMVRSNLCAIHQIGKTSHLFINDIKGNC